MEPGATRLGFWNAGEPRAADVHVDAFGRALNLKTLRTCSKMVHFRTGRKGCMGKLLFSEWPRSFPRTNEGWNSRDSCETDLFEFFCGSFHVCSDGRDNRWFIFLLPSLPVHSEVYRGKDASQRRKIPVVPKGLCGIIRLKDELLRCFHVNGPQRVQLLSDSLSFTPCVNTADTKFPGKTVV